MSEQCKQQLQDQIGAAIYRAAKESEVTVRETMETLDYWYERLGKMLADLPPENEGDEWRDLPARPDV